MPSPQKKATTARMQKKLSKNKQNIKIKQQLSHPNSTKPLNNIKQNLKNCSNIIEVTEEYETQRFNTQTIQQVSQLIKKNKKSIWSKACDCIKFIIPCFRKNSQFSIFVRQQELIKTIEKLRTQKLKIQPFLPPLTSNKKTLVLDIDQTLVFSSQSQLDKYDFNFIMPYKKSQIKVYTKNRFGLQSFLFQMSKIYEIVIYTTNIKQYAEAVIKNIDKKKRISHVLFKQKCLSLNKIHLLKSLKVLGRQPQNVIFIDHNVASGILQPKNFLQLKPYIGQRHDRQLVKLIPFLREIAEKETVMPVNKHYDEYCNRQIRLKFNSIDHSKTENKNEIQDKQNDYEERRKHYQSIMNGKKRKYGHKKNTGSQAEAIVKKCENQLQNLENRSQNSSTQETQIQLRQRDINLGQAI